MIRLVAPPTDHDVLSVTELTTVTEITQAPVTATWAMKQVRFKTSTLDDLEVAGPAPLPGAGPNEAAGVLGRVDASIPLLLNVTKEQVLDVGVDVTWRIERGDGTLFNVTWKLGSGASQVTGAGGSIAPPIGRALDELTLGVPMIFTELTSTTEQQRDIAARVRASVRLFAGGTSTEWIQLPPVDVFLPPAIPVPTLLFLFRGKDFGDKVLVTMPQSSPVGDDVVDRLNDLVSVLDPVRDATDLLSLFVSQLEGLATTLDGADVKVVKGDVENLEDVDLEDSTWWPNPDWDNRVSSLKFVGARGANARCYNAPDFDLGEGQLALSVDGALGYVSMSNMHSATPVAATSAATARVVTKPPGDRTWPARDVYSFGDEMSSIKFG